MEFKDRYELQDFLAEMLQKTIGVQTENISGESNDSTGRADIIIEFKNGDTATLKIEMEDKDMNSK